MSRFIIAMRKIGEHQDEINKIQASSITQLRGQLQTKAMDNWLTTVPITAMEHSDLLGERDLNRATEAGGEAASGSQPGPSAAVPRTKSLAPRTRSLAPRTRSLPPTRSLADSAMDSALAESHLLKRRQPGSTFINMSRLRARLRVHREATGLEIKDHRADEIAEGAASTIAEALEHHMMNTIDQIVRIANHRASATWYSVKKQKRFKVTSHPRNMLAALIRREEERKSEQDRQIRVQEKQGLDHAASATIQADGKTSTENASSGAANTSPSVGADTKAAPSSSPNGAGSAALTSASSRTRKRRRRKRVGMGSSKYMQRRRKMLAQSRASGKRVRPISVTDVLSYLEAAPVQSRKLVDIRYRALALKDKIGQAVRLGGAAVGAS